MSQSGRYVLGSGVLPPIETLTMDDGSVVSPDGAGNIDVIGSAGANGAINIQTDGTVSGLPASTAGLRLTDSILLPNTNAAGTQGVIALGSTDYITDRFIHSYQSAGLKTNTFVGYQAGNFTQVSAFHNTGIGYRALYSIRNVPVSVSNYTAIGKEAATALQNGVDSVVIGSGSLSRCVLGGDYVVAVGVGTLGNWIGGVIEGSVAVGYFSQNLVDSAVSNQSFGSRSLVNLTSGDRNEAYGYRAGENLTTTSDNLMIYSRGIVGDANTIRIGTQGNGNYQQNTCFIAGITGVTVSNTKIVTLDSTTGQLGVSNGTSVGETITGDSGGALSPTTGNWNIVGGTGCSTSGAGSTLTINTSGGGITWEVPIVPPSPATVNTGYFCDTTAVLLITLPPVSAVGDVVEIVNTTGAASITVLQGAGQQIFISTLSSTIGVTGIIVGGSAGDAIKLVCRVANLEWQATSVIGNWTVA